MELCHAKIYAMYWRISLRGCLFALSGGIDLHRTGTMNPGVQGLLAERVSCTRLIFSASSRDNGIWATGTYSSIQVVLLISRLELT